VSKIIGIYEWMLVFTEVRFRKITFFVTFCLNSSFSQTLQRVWQNLGSMTIADFVKECTNKTYNLPSGKGYFDQFGGIIRRPQPIKRVNWVGEFQVGLIKVLNTKLMEPLKNGN
jgi:hypothetical protein